jgi:hypothetical protein
LGPLFCCSEIVVTDKLIRLIFSQEDQASAGIAKMNGTLQTLVGTVGGNLLAGAIETADQAVVGAGTKLKAGARRKHRVRGSGKAKQPKQQHNDVEFDVGAYQAAYVLG